VDKSTIGGIILALAGILAGLIIEGGKIAQVVQPTAAMIVLGGTIGAVMIQFPLPVVFNAAKGLVNVFLDRGQEPHSLIKELVGYAISPSRGVPIGYRFSLAVSAVSSFVPV
jgi:chemotaxis protein MotA